MLYKLVHIGRLSHAAARQQLRLGHCQYLDHNDITIEHESSLFHNKIAAVSHSVLHYRRHHLHTQHTSPIEGAMSSSIAIPRRKQARHNAYNYGGSSDASSSSSSSSFPSSSPQASSSAAASPSLSSHAQSSAVSTPTSRFTERRASLLGTPTPCNHWLEL